MLGLWAVESPFLGYKDVYGGFGELWISGVGSAEELGIAQRHGQGCVEPSGGLEDPKFPLWALTGVQLAPTSPKLAEGRSPKLDFRFTEFRELR